MNDAAELRNASFLSLTNQLHRCYAYWVYILLDPWYLDAESNTVARSLEFLIGKFQGVKRSRTDPLYLITLGRQGDLKVRGWIDSSCRVMIGLECGLEGIVR